MSRFLLTEKQSLDLVKQEVEMLDIDNIEYCNVIVSGGDQMVHAWKE